MPYDDVYRAVAEILGMGTETRAEIDKTIPNLLEGVDGSVAKISCGDKHMAVLTSLGIFWVFLICKRRDRFGPGEKMILGSWEPVSPMRKQIVTEHPYLSSL
jgi:hypothetical protein